MLGLRRKVRYDKKSPPPLMYFEVLGSARVVAQRDGSGVTETRKLYYSRDGHPGQVMVSMTWETLAQMRRALQRAGRQVNDDELIDTALLEYGRRQLFETLSRGEPLPEAGYMLRFASAPNPSELPGFLRDAGLL